jgi:hypothetical protein
MPTLLDRLRNPRNRLARFYDAGPNTFDRYTVVYLIPDCVDEISHKWYSYRGCSAYPFSPTGIGIINQHKGYPIDWPNVASPGRNNHLGKRVPFDTLPSDIQTLIIQDLSSCNH